MCFSFHFVKSSGTLDSQSIRNFDTWTAFTLPPSLTAELRNEYLEFSAEMHGGLPHDADSGLLSVFRDCPTLTSLIITFASAWHPDMISSMISSCGYGRLLVSYLSKDAQSLMTATFSNPFDSTFFVETMACDDDHVNQRMRRLIHHHRRQ